MILWRITTFIGIYQPQISPILIFFILAGEEEEHNISDKFEFRPGSTKECRISCPLVLEKFPQRLTMGELF